MNRAEPPVRLSLFHPAAAVIYGSSRGVWQVPRFPAACFDPEYSPARGPRGLARPEELVVPGVCVFESGSG